MSHARVVDKNIQPVKACLDRSQQSFDCMRVPDITNGWQDANLATSQFPAGFVQRRLITTGDDQVASLSSECAGDGKANASVCAGDERDLIAKSFH